MRSCAFASDLFYHVRRYVFTSTRIARFEVHDVDFNDVVASILIDGRVHKPDDPLSWQKCGDFYISRVFTLNKAKLSVMIGAEVLYLVLKKFLVDSFERESQTRVPFLMREAHLRMSLNLFTVILASQRQHDQKNLALARYIGMYHSNNNRARGSILELFKKLIPPKTRLSLFVWRRFIQSYEEMLGDKFKNARITDVKIEYRYKSWLSSAELTDQGLKISEWYYGNLYAKFAGEDAAQLRAPLAKILDLAYKAIDMRARGPDDPHRMNRVGEKLLSYDEHYQVNFQLLTRVIRESMEQHTRDNPNWKVTFEKELLKLVRNNSAQNLATEKSTFVHESDSFSDGARVVQKDSGRTTQIKIRNPNKRSKV